MRKIRRAILLVDDGFQQNEVFIVRRRKVKLEPAWVIDRFFPIDLNRRTGFVYGWVRRSHDAAAWSALQAGVLSSRRKARVGQNRRVRESMFGSEKDDGDDDQQC